MRVQQGGPHEDSMYLVLPVPFRVHDGRMFVEAQAANGRRHGNSQLGEALNVGINEVHRTRFCRSEIHFNGLPRAGPILDSNFDTNRVSQFHIPGSRFKCKRQRNRIWCRGRRQW